MACMDDEEIHSTWHQSDILLVSKRQSPQAMPAGFEVLAGDGGDAAVPYPSIN